MDASRRRKIVAAALSLLCLSAVPAASPAISTAQFVDSAAADGNTISDGSLAPPTSPAASFGDTITVTWTASTSTRATGYHIYRSATSGTLGSLVATVTPVSATSWVDNSPVEGKNYYVIKTYLQNWETESVESVGTRPLTVIDNFNSTGAIGVSETGGRTWQEINGTWSRSGSGTATTTAAATANPMVVTDLQTPDVDLRANVVTRSGEAEYFRVSDATNWLRTRVQRDDTSNTFTEYQYNDYEWYDTYQPKRQQPQWQPKKKQDYVQRISRTWSAYTNFADIAGTDTGCRGTAPTAPADDLDDWGNPIKQYRWTGIGQGGCNTGQNIYREQERHRTYSDTTTYFWADDPYTPVWGCCNHESLTGTTQIVNNGATYYADSATGSYDTQTGVYQLVNNGSTYTKMGTASTQSTAPTGTYDAYLSTASSFTGNTYWATGPEATGPTDPATGSSRQTTTTTSTYTLVCEESAAGTITALGSWSVSSGLTTFQTVVTGSTIKVYADGTLKGTVTDAFNQNVTRHGVGLGGATTVAPTNAVTYVYIKGLS